MNFYKAVAKNCVTALKFIPLFNSNFSVNNSFLDFPVLECPLHEYKLHVLVSGNPMHIHKENVPVLGKSLPGYTSGR